MIVVSKPQQIVDMVAVRLFLFPDTKTTYIIHDFALSWTARRDIPVAFRNMGGKAAHYITLPQEYDQYLDWSLCVMVNDRMQEALQISLDLLMDTGWTSIRRRFKPFTKEERIWILDNVPNHYTDLTRRKAKS